MISNESALLERCRCRDEAAWAELYREYAPRVQRFLRVTTGANGDVEELVQRVFVELLGSIGRFRGDSALSTFLFRIASRVASRAARTERRHRRRSEAWGWGFVVTRGSSVPAPDVRVEARDHLGLLASAALELPIKLRLVWVMRELEGLATEEVSTALGIPVATVRTRHFRARKQVLNAVAEAEKAAKPRSEGSRDLEAALNAVKSEVLP